MDIGDILVPLVCCGECFGRCGMSGGGLWLRWLGLASSMVKKRINSGAVAQILLINPHRFRGCAHCQAHVPETQAPLRLVPCLSKRIVHDLLARKPPRDTEWISREPWIHHLLRISLR